MIVTPHHNASDNRGLPFVEGGQKYSAAVLQPVGAQQVRDLVVGHAGAGARAQRLDIVRVDGPDQHLVEHIGGECGGLACSVAARVGPRRPGDPGTARAECVRAREYKALG
jgi:hypothetical protein